MNLKTKLGLFSTVLTACVISGSFSAFYISEKEKILNESRSFRLNLIKNLQIVSQDAILGNDVLPLLRYLRGIKTVYSEILWVSVLHHGEIIANTEGSRIGESPSDSFSLNAIGSVEILEQVYTAPSQNESLKVLEVSAPILAGTAKIGTVRIGFSDSMLTNQINESLKQTAKKIMRFGIVSTILGTLGAFVLAGSMTRRLDQLARAVRSVARGNFQPKTFLEGSDEIALLAREFDSMSQRLGELVTQISEQSEILTRTNAKLKELNSLKDYFFSLVNHELRAPLTSIKGYAALLLSGRAGEAGEKQREYFQEVAEESSRMEKLVNELVELSRIESGKFSVERQKINIQEMLHSFTNTIKLRTENQKIQFECMIEDGLKEIWADRKRLIQVLNNLMENALKFTSCGGKIFLKVSSRSESAQDRMMLFQVRDTGRGIPKDFLEKIFQKYVQIESSESEDEKRGLGLGLVIAKEIVEKHGGKIWAESKGAGQGATFSFLIPINQTER